MVEKQEIPAKRCQQCILQPFESKCWNSKTQNILISLRKPDTCTHSIKGRRDYRCQLFVIVSLRRHPLTPKRDRHRRFRNESQKNFIVIVIFS